MSEPAEAFPFVADLYSHCVCVRAFSLFLDILNQSPSQQPPELFIQILILEIQRIGLTID